MQQVILIITLMNSGHIYLPNKGFCTVYFGAKEKMQLHYHIVHKGSMHFWGNQGNVKDKEITSKEENCSIIITSKIRSQIHQINVGWG